MESAVVLAGTGTTLAGTRREWEKTQEPYGNGTGKAFPCKTLQQTMTSILMVVFQMNLGRFSLGSSSFSER